MSCDWPLVKLDELANEITVGFVGSMTHEYVDKGVPFFRSKNISEYEIEWYDIRYISPAFHRRLKKSVLRPGDVAIVRTGKPGTACVIPDSVDEANCSDIVIVRVNNDKLSAHYLCYFMNSVASHQVSSHLVGAVQQHFNVASAKTIKIPLPKRDEQEEIVKILKALDDKRKINHKINQTLEAMAQAIFKSWFVDFEPVKAKIAAIESGEDAEGVTRAAMRTISGKTDEELDQFQVEQPEHYTQLKTTAELFPAAMQDSELGEVPEGWEVKPLGNYLVVKRGGSPRPIKDFIVPSGLPWVKIADATAQPSPFLFKTKEFIKPEGLKKTVLLKKGSLILSNSATPGLPKFLELNACIHDGWLHFPKKKLYSDVYLYHLFLELRTKLVAQGNGSVFTNLKTDILRNQVVVAPPKEIINKFDDSVVLIFEKLKESCVEINLLSQLRDTLLPVLLSGELSVDVSDFVEEN